MKKSFACLITGLLLFSLIGCAGFSFENVGDVKTTAVLAGIAAYEIGYTVGQLEDAEIDRAIQNTYKLAKTGTLDQDGMNQVTDLLAKKIPDRPTLPRNIMSLLQLVGVRFNLEGVAVGLDEIPPEVLKAVEQGYLDGVDLYLRQKKGDLSAADVDKILEMLRNEFARIARQRKGA